MKYTALKSNIQKNFTIPVLDGGVKFTENSEDIKPNQIAFCKNVWCKNRRIKTRPALRTKIENIIGKSIVDEGLCYDCFLYDAEIVLEGAYYKIATAEVFLSDSAYFVYVFLIDEDGILTEIGNMPFLRTSGSAFFIPENITFYSGKKQNGGGIFALITLVNMIGFEEHAYKIYEIGQELDGWSENYNYYVPTVYINGRGNNYELAKKIDIAYTGAPKELEPLNLLDGSFYAYYSSDSYSTSFRLPFSQLASDNVICRLYINNGEYIEWLILADSTEKTLDFSGKKVTMRIEREKGVISFYSDNQPYALPQMENYKENNMRFFARKDISGEAEKIISCMHTAVSGDKTVFSGGIATGEIYFSRYSNPLYFPMLSENQVGTPNNEITAIKFLKNRIIAFKNTEVYAVEITDGNPLNTTNLLIDNQNIFYNEAKLKITSLNNTVGCDNKLTISDINGNLIWQNKGREVCSLSDNKIYNLSESIKPYLDELVLSDDGIICSAVYENNYILCAGSKVFVLNFKSDDNKENSWYIWEFPSNSIIIGAYSFKGKSVFLCSTENKDIFFTSVLEDGIDSVLTYNKGIQKSEIKIESVIKTKKYRLKGFGRSVKLTKAYLELEIAGNTNIAFSSDENIGSFMLTKTDVCNNVKLPVKFAANLKCNNGVDIEIKSKDKISVGSAELYYTETI